MEIGGIGTGGLDYQSLREMREAMSGREGSSRSGSSHSSVAPIGTGSSSSTSQNSNDSKNNQQSTSQETRNQEQLSDPAAGLRAHAHRFAIDQALRQTGVSSTTFDSSLQRTEADTKAETSLKSSGTAGSIADAVPSKGTLFTSQTPSFMSNSVKLSLATSPASAITAKYATQTQVPVLNSFEPVDKYI